MSKVVLEQVSKVIDGFAVVDNLSLDVADGEIITLVGPFGCGHTMVLRLIAGLESISSGAISIDGRGCEQWLAAERAAALVAHTPTDSHQTVDRYLRAHPVLRRNPALANERIQFVAQRLDLGDMLYRPLEQLSVVQRLSLSIGWAAVGKPPVLLVPDLLINLDAQLHDKTRRIVKRQLQSLGSTIIYATHHAVDAMALGDRLVFLREGKLEQIGEPHTVYRHPANLLVSRYLGDLPINLITATIIEDQGSILARSEDGLRLALPPASQERLANYLGREVMVGIRPEAIEWLGPSQSDPSGAGMRASVVVAEYLGADMVLTVHVGATTLLARVNPDCQVRRGDGIELVVDPMQVHIFDRHTEKIVV